MFRRLFNPERRITLAATADQGVVSLGAFLTNLLLARHLPPHVYGGYVVIYGVLLVSYAIHSALIAIPMCIKAAAAPQETRKYVSASVWFTLAMSPIFGAVVLFAALRLDDWRIGATAALALAAWLLQETFRRGLIARLRYTSCIAGDALTYIGQAGAVYYLLRTDSFTVPRVFLTLALMASLGAMVQAALVGMERLAHGALREYARQFWALGGWMLTGGAAHNLCNQIFPWTLAAAFGAAAAARYQAALTPLGAVHPLLFSLSNVVTPAVAAVRAEGRTAVNRVARHYGIQFAALALPYLIALAIVPTKVLALFYGKNSPYLDSANVVRIFVAAYLLMFFVSVLGGLLNGLEHSRASSNALVTALLGAAAIGVPLSVGLGVMGAVIGFFLATAFRTLLLARALRRIPPDEPHSAQLTPFPALSAGAD
jgi:O-antigen/teichoic acid export membrane protein